ncbi:MAG: ferredoxin:CoB-CoM heterodisulfide reductase subunit HdrC [Methanobacteriaceae archaeon]
MNELKINDKSLELAKEILANLKASEDLGLLKCVQCGMCTSVCPAAKNSDYNPRDMIESVLKGDERVIEDENIWKCFYCYSCHSICPVGNSACEVNQILKQIGIDNNIALEEVKPFVGYVESFIALGIGVNASKFLEEMKKDIDGYTEFKENLDKIRKELDLGPPNPSEEAIKEIGMIAKKCGFEERLAKIKTAGMKNTETEASEEDKGGN